MNMLADAAPNASCTFEIMCLKVLLPTLHGSHAAHAGGHTNPAVSSANLCAPYVTQHAA